MTPTEAELTALGATVQFSAEVRDQNGSVMTGSAVSWSSSNASVATVDASGLVTAADSGTASITATSGSASGSAALTVAQGVSMVAVYPPADTLVARDDTVRLAAEATDANGHVVAGAEFTWASGDTAVATVDASGLVTAAGNGTATIAATSGSASGEARVTVMQAAGSVVVSPAADTVALGDTLRFEAEAFDANGNAVAGAAFVWSSSDTSVATVDSSGLVRGSGEGMATITAMAGDARGVSEITVANPDRAALVAFYEATDGPNWVNNDGWLTDVPLRDWYGVHTDGTGRVVHLRLNGTWDNENLQVVPHGLAGPIPPELGNLGKLIQLNLWGNNLAGPVPVELGNLANLNFLGLGENQLTGPIPAELGNLDKLLQLSLWGNNLTGSIPAELV